MSLIAIQLLEFFLNEQSSYSKAFKFFKKFFYLNIYESFCKSLYIITHNCNNNICHKEKIHYILSIYKSNLSLIILTQNYLTFKKI